MTQQSFIFPTLITIFTVSVLLSRCDGAQMTQYAFNASDFCAMKVIVRCFTSSKMGLPRQTCGAQNVFELARQGVGNRNRCMQATKITKWLQTFQIDTDALKNEVTSDCGAFQQINRCVVPYKEHCHQVFNAFGLNMFLQQWNYICDPNMYPRLEKHILCRRELPDVANEECRKFAPVLGIDFENSSLSSNMTDDECEKFKLILGCRAKILLANCEKGHGVLAAHFLLDFFNIQSESVGTTCLFEKDADPVKLASSYEKFITEFAKKSEAVTRRTTPITTTTTTRTTTTSKLKAIYGGRKPKVPVPEIEIYMPDGGANEGEPVSTNELEEYETIMFEESESSASSFLNNAHNSLSLVLLTFHVFHAILRY